MASSTSRPYERIGYISKINELDILKAADENSLVYLDDLLIYSGSDNKHE